MVDGDHRVAIMANRDLAEGDELYYNYNYDRRVRQGSMASGRGV